MSDENEQGGGVGAGGILGGAAAGAGAGYYMANSATNTQVKQALAGEKVSEKLSGQVTGALEKDAALVTHNTTLKNLKSTAPEGFKGTKPNLESVTFSGKKGAYEATGVLKNGQSATLPGIKNLPKGVEADKIITDKKAIGGLFEGGAAKTKFVMESEQSLVKGVRKTGNIGFMNGFHGSTGSGKAKIIGATVAAAVAGGFVMHKLFGGNHTKRVEAERQVQQDMGRA